MTPGAVAFGAALAVRVGAAAVAAGMRRGAWLRDRGIVPGRSRSTECAWWAGVHAPDAVTFARLLDALGIQAGTSEHDEWVVRWFAVASRPRDAVGATP